MTHEHQNIQQPSNSPTAHTAAPRVTANPTHPVFSTLIFDLDGTLLDTLPDLVALTNGTLQEMGFPPRTTEEIHSFVGNGIQALIYQAIPETATPDQAEAAMQRWKELYPIAGNKLTRPYPHIPETLAALKQQGIRLGVLSNKFDQGVHDVITTYLPGYFEVMHGEREDIPRKPDPTGLLRTIKELGSTPEETAYVGDSGVDVAVARNAGVFSIGVDWGYHSAEKLSEERADVVISDARALLDFVQPGTEQAQQAQPAAQPVQPSEQLGQ